MIYCELQIVQARVPIISRGWGREMDSEKTKGVGGKE